MGLTDEPRLYENEEGRGPVGAEQRLRAALKSGNGPLTGVNWKHHKKVTASNVETFSFYDNKTDLTLLATAILTYEDDTLCNLLESEFTIVGA